MDSVVTQIRTKLSEFARGKLDSRDLQALLVLCQRRFGYDMIQFLIHLIHVMWELLLHKRYKTCRSIAVACPHICDYDVGITWCNLKSCLLNSYLHDYVVKFTPPILHVGMAYGLVKSVPTRGVNKLHDYIYTGNTGQVSKLLIKYGISLLLAYYRCKSVTAIYTALYYEKMNIARILLQFGDNIDMRVGVEANTISHVIFMYGSDEAVIFLHDHQANLYIANANGTTP